MIPHNVTQAAKEWATERLVELEELFEADTITIIGPIFAGLESWVRAVVEDIPEKKKSLMVILDTSGGITEVAERIARTFRHYYREVKFLVPDKAMSAGTILVMSGDAILMDHHSVLGPIDPQVERDGSLVPALSYLTQYDRMVEKANNGKLTTADIVLLSKLDLAELHRFELARELSISLLKEWLTKYKFKDWKKTETRGKKVTRKMKEDRAAEIADALSKHERWHTHGRGIDMHTLHNELNLRIDDFGDDRAVQGKIWNYFWFLRDLMNQHDLLALVHTRNYI